MSEKPSDSHFEGVYFLKSFIHLIEDRALALNYSGSDIYRMGLMKRLNEMHNVKLREDSASFEHYNKICNLVENDSFADKFNSINAYIAALKQETRHSLHALGFKEKLIPVPPSPRISIAQLEKIAPKP